MNKLATVLSCVVLSSMIAAPMAFAQDNPGDRGGERGDRGDRGDDRGRGGFDPARMREMIVDRMKTELAPSDEEWGIIKPKLEKVLEARFTQMVSGFGGFGRGRGGPEGGGEEREPRNDVERASRDLRRTLDESSATPETIAAKLQAVRDARAKAQAEVKATQEDLKSVLTARQEAVLVVNGMLE